MGPRRALITAPYLVVTATLLLASPGFAQFGRAIQPEWNATFERDTLHPGATLRGWLSFSFPEPWHVNARHPKEDTLIPTILEVPSDPGPVRISGVVYPQPKSFRFEFSDEEVLVYGPRFVIGIIVETDHNISPGSYTIPLNLRYQACNNTTCMPPRTLEIPLAVTVTGDEGQESAVKTPPEELDWSAAEYLETARTPSSETTETETALRPAPAPPDKAATPEARTAPPGNWRELAERFTITGRLDGFVGTTAFLDFVDAAERGEDSSGQGFGQRRFWIVLLLILGGGLLLNLTPCVLPMIPINLAIIGAGTRAGSKSRGFVLGLAYGAGISIVYGLLGLAVVLGISTAFGTINATVWFNVLIALLFVVLALAMFDLVQIDFSRYQSRFNLSGRAGSTAAALGMGAVSALLAGACVAPVVIYTVVYAQDLYSQGNRGALLLPFLLGVGMALPWPFLGMGLSLLPRPGKWMTRVKQGFGVFILLFALYYAHLGWTLWHGQKEPAAAAEGWTPSLEAGLRQALETNQPVIIDFWATWCKNCAVMDRQTLKDPRVVERLSGYSRVKYQAEDLEAPETREVTRYFEVKGLPTFIILKPKP
ncbi:MAG TPA: cytochrome c biogenesis protein CcdA [Candidatus Hydrogenedentes bacterium]|nr:cytochrome c biogenesis protein CcdA [Candidatus Hydrogenedentota bacterium]